MAKAYSHPLTLYFSLFAFTTESRINVVNSSWRISAWNSTRSTKKSPNSSTGNASKLIKESEETKKSIADKEVEVGETLSLLNSKMETIGNLIHDFVPISNDEANNVVVRSWGEKRVEPKLKNHVDLVELLEIADTNKGLNRAILQIISHGFIGVALFFLAGTSYDRLRLLYLEKMGGMAIPMPKIFMVFTILSMASLALPGMSGFVAELIKE
ncbi:hypothetical protein Fmac_018174 [Flemingia macrophylla]|uniref:NADH:quinone oxidoreductase/Mrp antiporter transmembrane domain-containing protein n=1 Tax=Flemingia macrophylla TaxID=520843 RepID=A0ABD1M481_9FABA